MNPLEWLSWFYGKFFVDSPIWVGYVFVCCLSALLTAVLMALVWTRAIDKYNQEYPRTDAPLPLKQIHQNLQAVYEIHKKDLGPPVRPAQIIPEGQLYQAKHERAVIIWLHHESRIYQLSQSGKARIVNHPVWPTNEWKNDEFLRKRFKPPKALAPPWAGVAKEWSSDPKSWEQIGWREWHCYFEKNEIAALPIYQKFQNGIVIAGLLPTYKWDGDAQVYIINNDGTWLSQPMHGSKAPKRVEPKEE